MTGKYEQETTGSDIIKDVLCENQAARKATGKRPLYDFNKFMTDMIACSFVWDRSFRKLCDKQQVAQAPAGPAAKGLKKKK